MNPVATGRLGRDFYRRLAEHAGLRYMALDPDHAGEHDFAEVSPLAARLFSGEICRYHRMIPVTYIDGVLTVAIAAPADDAARDTAVALTDYAVSFVVSAEADIDRAIDEVFGSVLEHEVDTEVDWPGQHYPPRLGATLVSRGLVDSDEVKAALEEQQRVGTRLGEILMSSGALAQADYMSLLSEQSGIPLIDLSEYEPDPAALGLLPEPVMRRLRVIPLALDAEKLYVAITEPLSEADLRTLRQHVDLTLQPFLATRSEVDQLMRRAYRDKYTQMATTELMRNMPEECANRVLSDGQKTTLSLLLVVTLTLLIFFPKTTLIVLISLAAFFYATTSLYKFWLTYTSLSYGRETAVSDEAVAAIDERELPVYSILVPLFREAAVVPQLLASMERLDYPASKLDVRLLCEEGDDETIDAVMGLALPPHFKLVVVPDSQPKTKPKALNFGLLQVEGDYLVIYDAEDRPEPDQLKKAVLVFRDADPRLACVQAKLNYYNVEQNLLTRWFCTEYSMWFDLLLPGLHHSHAPIPLGGTSCHFVVDRLVELEGWDPFNVTEDADLGIRLHKFGYQTAVLDSTTFEEANSDLGNWVRQRSRWIKGYVQTWLVHSRRPGRLIGQVGIRGWFSFQMLIGGTFIFLLNPIFWALTTIFFLTQAGFVRELFPGFIFYVVAFQLFVGNFIFTYLMVAGAIQRGYYGLAKFALFTPVYWGLMSIAAWKGFAQLFYRPFYWEKTVHGLDKPS